jgi:branched-subunit amino acid aminotransferase/4-amino-4-deoxychorismate lyase
MSYCFLNGEIVPEEKAQVSVKDIGLLRAYGVYDGLAGIGSTPLFFHDHYGRFKSSAHFLELRVPLAENEMRAVVEDLLIRHGFERSDIRVILTGGETKFGIEPTGTTFFILIEEHLLNGNTAKEGASVILHEFARQDPVHKTINYATAVRLQPQKKKAGASEILFHFGGKILEASTSNVFIVKDGKIITPKEGILLGITRKYMLQIAGERGVLTEERDVSLEEFWGADEVFITSSFKDIVPITKADDRIIGDGKVGPVSIKLQEEFNKLILGTATALTLNGAEVVS